MKYISHYFPFFILTVLIYGLIFHFNKQSTALPALPVNSGQQAMQLQFVEIAPPEAVTSNEPEKKQPVRATKTKNEITTAQQKITENKDQPASQKESKKQPVKAKIEKKTTGYS